MSGAILFLTRWPIHEDERRWENRLAAPDLVFDPETDRVTYLCDEGGRSGVPADAERVHVVTDFGDVDAVLELVDTIVREEGPFDHVIAFSEILLGLAATLRERHGVPGSSPEETSRFSDKTVMKEKVSRAGLRVPRWASCRTEEQILAAAEEFGYPVIVKPVRGASSQGVREIASAQELRALCAERSLREYEIEEFVQGDILHVDGVLDAEGKPSFICTSRYVSTCLDFELLGAPLGSVLQTDPEVRARCEEFALRCLSALGLRSSAFHLELFDTGSDLVFLEVGARVPGADVSYVINDVHDVNLFRLWVDVLLGRPVDLPVPDMTLSGGWLIVQGPKPLPQKVTAATPLLDQVPYLYRELVPRPGEVLESRPGAYATLQGGRFLFRGGTQEEIEEALRQARAQYRLTTVPVA
ncbi:MULTISPECIES: ATP-grasp domain-containing protein [Streptomyces]|uniref:ATP-grasp domain-containing protein n=1 Tax=Streptomyces doudnae TaxID=3075536 RepID=A0ABD5EUF4_9ACTN|nr:MULTISPECIES: ATP-grasp domain-containing protein [unclassified Streptomyces]MDT0438361.1 ATP-grasp domain-containing protein [Streptomyces sp. DSM 41981]MYQ65519.1 ATP-grasp domain-containing protein [Streptomyces sp. SID4950]SCE01622.1 Biotin carboxylase [Streptomyces sp. SolWspMP-5a-2]